MLWIQENQVKNKAKIASLTLIIDPNFLDVCPHNIQTSGLSMFPRHLFELLYPLFLHQFPEKLVINSNLKDGCRIPQMNGVIRVIWVIGVIDAELSGLQMGNPNNSVSITLSTLSTPRL